MARIVETRPATGVAGPTVVDDGTGFGIGMVVGVLVAIAVGLWATGSFNNSTTNRPGKVVTSVVPGSNGTGSTGTNNGTGSSGSGASTTP